MNAYRRARTVTQASITEYTEVTVPRRYAPWPRLACSKRARMYYSPQLVLDLPQRYDVIAKAVQL